ncbi:MAG: hypothetical protein I8H75_00305 [Myxococcaceae bacterium]|nr:hypothetical protein [Myxococcaceae bacterium]MBH2005786.1 hypothetical protein [Myxococcaceae bacterium]
MTQKRRIFLQNALTLLCEAQKQASNFKDETQGEIRQVMHQVAAQAKESVNQLIVAWNENKSCLPSKLSSEMDRILDKVGILKKTKPRATPKKATAKKSAAPKKKAASSKAAPKKPRAPRSSKIVDLTP